MTKLISTVMEITAPPERVWHVLTDFAAYPPGAKASRFTPTVLAAEANRELRWKGKLLVRGLFDGDHSFGLEPTETGTRFVHAERFSGILAALIGASMFERIQRGFIEMNEAIKHRAEAR
jgi:hypothetical protein